MTLVSIVTDSLFRYNLKTSGRSQFNSIKKSRLPQLFQLFISLKMTKYEDNIYFVNMKISGIILHIQYMFQGLCL